MKTKYWIIICIFIFLLGNGTYALIDYKLFPCPKADDFSATPGPENDPEPREGVPDPYKCGKTLKIDGERIDPQTLRVKAWTDYLSNYRDFHLDFSCPYMPKWTLQLGIIGGLGYFEETKKFDALVGMEGALFRHYKNFAVGGGIWYMQGMTTNYKAGGVKVDLLFSWGKQ